MFNFKIVENSVVNLALIPSPLIIIEMLNWDRLKERIVITSNYTADDATENTESK